MPDLPEWPEPGAVGGSNGTSLAGPPSGPGAVRTPHPVSIGRRMASGLIDVVLVTLALLVYTAVFGKETGELTKAASVSMRFNSKQITGGAVWLFALLALLYFFVTELVVGGSIGKRLLGQRVVMDDGSKLTLSGAAIRTLLRPIDGIPWIIPNLLGFIVVAVNSKHRRIGDLLGRTMVISEK